MGRIICFTAMVVCVVGCVKQQQDREAIIINVDHTKAEEWFDVSVILENSVEIIPLQTTDESLIAEVSDVRIVEDKLFVTDLRTGQILAFDRKGNFLRRIGRKGRGPKEYHDLTASEITDEYVLVFDKLTRKLYFYRHDGSFVRAKDISDLWAHDVVEVNDKIYFVNAVSSADKGFFHLFELSREGNFITAAMPFSEAESELGWGQERYYSKNNDELMIYNPPYDSLFVMNGTNLANLYFVDFGLRKAPDGVIKSGYNAIRTILDKKYIAGANNVHFTDNYIIITFLEEKPYTAIYDKTTGDCRVSVRQFDSRFPGLWYWFKTNMVRDNVLIAPMEVADLKGVVDENEAYAVGEPRNDFQLRIIELAKSLDDLDNPVLFVQKFK